KRSAHLVGSLTGKLGYHVVEIIDDIDIVAVKAHQRVGATAAVEPIVASAANDGIAQIVADPGEIAASGEDQVLDVVAEYVHRRFALDRIGALVRILEHGVKGTVDDVNIAAAAAPEEVVAGRAVERVRPVIADDGVVELVAGEVDPRGAGPVGGFQQLDLGAG